MLTNKDLQRFATKSRAVTHSKVGDRSSDQAMILGPLKDLPGTWKSLNGRGWNMIALPFATAPDSPLNYRLLLNQYNETLKFDTIDGPVPNRGISVGSAGSTQSDQFLAALDYSQMIHQVAVDDFPPSANRGNSCDPIHHEPGLWLHITNETTGGLDIARLGTVPHGDSLLALGSSTESSGVPSIPDISGLPLGVSEDLNSRYLAPYKHFHDDPFEGLFDPVHPNRLLVAANEGVDIVKTMSLSVDTTIESGGIVNIPFIERQANAADMKFTMWIEELAEKDAAGNPMLRLQYSQVVLLDFFPRRDGLPGLIRWPHVSINTLVRTDQQDPHHPCEAAEDAIS